MKLVVVLKKDLQKDVGVCCPERFQIRINIVQLKNGKEINRFECEYFTVENINGVAVVKLKKDALKFKTLPKIPKKLFLDEATHLSALEIQILDAYAESIGAVNYLAGDPNQRGAFSAKASTGNLQEDQVFASRAPKLSISLRDNNLQKYINQENVRALLDTVNDSVLDLSEEELQQFWPRALNTLSKFNFRVYNHDELNGDLITSDLSPELLNKLKGNITEVIKGESKSREKTIGFIGEGNSPYLQKLRDAGLNPTVLSMDQMQGEEFDFVVVDKDWKSPKGIWIQEFLRDLYTTMTRARTASIFIDNGLSGIIGKNVKSDNKSKAPSILEGVKELREKKLSVLNQFKLDLEEIKTEQVKTETEPETKNSTGNPDEDFINPDDKNIDSDITLALQQMSTQDEKQVEETQPNNFSKDGEQVVETYTDITILGVEKTEKQKRTIKYNGKDVEVEVPVWIAQRPQKEEDPLRNLQALYTTKDRPTCEFISYSDKQDAQKSLFDLKSCIIYQHSYDSLPPAVKRRINKQSWE